MERNRDGTKKRVGKPVPKVEEKRHPLVSYQLNPSPTVSISVAVWSNIVKGTNGDYEKLSMTIKRRYRKDDDEWYDGGSFSASEIPILNALTQKAFDFMLERRMNESQ